MLWIHKLDCLCQRVAKLCGVLACSAMLLLLINVFYDVVMRYAFNDVSIGMQELEWHLFSCLFLFGIPYAIQQDNHVRVDIFYDRWTNQRKAWVNLLGTLFLILPFICLVSWYSVGFAYEAYVINEGSGDPGGLPYRWIIKSMIPTALILTGIASIGMITQSLKVLLNHEDYPARHKEPLA